MFSSALKWMIDLIESNYMNQAPVKEKNDYSQLKQGCFQCDCLSRQLPALMFYLSMKIHDSSFFLFKLSQILNLVHHVLGTEFSLTHTNQENAIFIKFPYFHRDIIFA